MRSEQEIQKDVMEELKWQAVMNTFKPTEIGVSVRNGVVTLNGMVDSFTKKMAAEAAAVAVEGVKAVANDIEVKLPDIFKRNDTEIAEAILNIMQWNTSIPHESIKVKVEDGWVTLEGDVEWNFQKKATKRAVENVLGVRGIINHIKVSSSKPGQAEVKEKIKDAFRRNYYLDEENIIVKVEGNKAILEGKVRSISEKKAAENAAWSAPGIAFVDNKLGVEHTKLTPAVSKPRTLSVIK